MGLLVVGLLGFGTGGLNGNIRNVGTVGEKPISVNQYQRAVNERIQTFSAQFGTPIGFQQAQQMGLDQAALAQIVTMRAMENEAAELGISVGDDRVRTEVLRIPSFRGIDGQFDREAYRFALQQSGLTETTFEAGIRDEISRTLLQGAVVGGTPLPDAYANALAQYIGENRSVTWATVTADMLTAPVAGPADADLQTYYYENPDAFTSPETRAISYAWLTPDMIQDEVTIDEEALRELYEERIADYKRPERRLVERLVYVDEDAAIAARDTLGDDVTFEALVADRGLDLADVDLGDVSAADLGPAAEIVFAAEVSEVVGPLNTSLGPALFRVNAVLNATEVSFEDASGDLREELSSARAKRIIEDGLDRMNDLLAGGATVEDLAEQTDMQLGNIAWSAGTQDGIAAYQSFRDAAAVVQEGDFAALVDMEDGGVFALRLDSITAPALREFADVRHRVEEGWRTQATQDAVLAQAETMAADILPLTGFETLGLTAQTEAALTRRSFVGGTPPVFVSDVFDMETGDVRVLDNGTDAIIVRLDGITDADLTDEQTAAQQQAAAENAAAGISQDIFEAFAASVQGRTDVVINQAAVNAVNANFQ